MSSLTWFATKFEKQCRFILSMNQNFINSFFFSSISFEFVFAWKSFFLKKAKISFKSKRLFRTLTVVRNEEFFIRVAIKIYDVNRKIIKNRLNDKRIKKEFAQQIQKLTFEKKIVIFRFIDDYIALRFSSRQIMIIEKTQFLLFKRRVINSIMKMHWMKKFLNRHQKYRIKFFKHLNQIKHFNFDFIVFENRFKLYQRIVESYEIEKNDTYNINKKKYLMKINKNVK